MSFWANNVQLYFHNSRIRSKRILFKTSLSTYWDCPNNKSKLSNENSNNDKNKLIWMDLRNNNYKDKIFFFTFFINFLCLTDWVLNTCLLSLDYEILKCFIKFFSFYTKYWNRFKIIGAEYYIQVYLKFLYIHMQNSCM